MKIKIKRLNNDFHFEAENEKGCTISMDANESAGGKNNGMTPMELLPSAVGTCSSLDIVNILKKQKEDLHNIQVEVNAERESGKDANLFTKIDLHFILKGNLNKNKVERAIDLAVNKYCSVGKTLEKAGAKISYTYKIIQQ